MQMSRSSVTAEQMALSRAIETRKPPEERICCDPLAERFLGPKYRCLLLGRPLRDAVERRIESRFAGHHSYVVARTRYFDDFLQGALARKPAQLVILGAGFDSRAHRFADALRAVAVFEVDHPATSAAKRAKIAGTGDFGPGPTYVAVDFQVQTLAGELAKHGYEERGTTVFLWEGVTPYLSDDAVADVLGFIRTRSGPGSVVLFDYIVKSAVDGTCTMRGAENELARMRQTSEPLTFGIADGAVEPYLQAHGFADVVDVGAEELKGRYFAGHMERYVKPWWRIVAATAR